MRRSKPGMSQKPVIGWPRSRVSKLVPTGRGVLVLIAILALFPAVPPPVAEAACSNPVACENQLAGTPQTTWDIVGAGDASIQGFATDISSNVGGTVSFKINSTGATAYTLSIYRLGYYQGNGARLIATISPSVALPQIQPACLSGSSTGLG